MRVGQRPLLIGAALILTGCASQSPSSPDATDSRRLIDRSLPSDIADRAGWESDISAVFSALKIDVSRENVCAVIAVTQQESGFRVDPVIPNLGAIARAEIDKRAAHADIPLTLVHAVLEVKSSSGQSYSERIDRAKTEKDLSDIFEDFTGAVPLGRTLFSGWNPIRTRGPMQVNVAFAEQFSAGHAYPYPIKAGIDDELFTRRGSLYFGTAHLLAYQAPYDRYLYRFADYNAGQFSSRNAAFQLALSRVSGIPVTPDGALLPHGRSDSPGSTELAARALGKRLNLSDSDIHADLEEGRTPAFERSVLYRGVFDLADRGRAASPREALPRIKLQGPKITRNLTTEWYARRVEGRYESCLNR